MKASDEQTTVPRFFSDELPKVPLLLSSIGQVLLIENLKIKYNNS